MARIRQKTLQFPGLNNVYTFADEADLFDASVNCIAGKYYIYSGDLYICTANHSGAWDEEDFEAVKIGDEVSKLRNSIEGDSESTQVDFTTVAGEWINTNSVPASENGYARTDYIPCDGWVSFKLTGETNSNNRYYAFYDANKNPITTRQNATYDTDIAVNSPAKYLIFASSTYNISQVTITATAKTRLAKIEDEIEQIESNVVSLIPSSSIAQDILSFAQLDAKNIFNYEDPEVVYPGYWYYDTTIGHTVQLDQNTTTIASYHAIKIPCPKLEKITLNYVPSLSTGKLFWIGAVDADMKLISYAQANTVLPYTFTVPSGTAYILLSMQISPSSAQSYLPYLVVGEGETASVYYPYSAPVYTLSNVKIANNSSEMLKAADEYDLVVGDTFQLFYKGIINNPRDDLYDVSIESAKGDAFNRFFEITPSSAETLLMNIYLYDYKHDLVEIKDVSLNIRAKATSPANQKNILCVGDSLTQSGVWVKELKRRLTDSGGSPEGDNLSNINFIGTCSNDGANYEGYGGWSFNSYNTSNVNSASKIITCTHDKTEAEDQHSIYKDSANYNWKLETIENGSIKIIAVSGDGSSFPSTGTLTWVSGGTNHGDIIYTASENAPSNPFWNSSESKVDFASYCSSLGVSSLDYVLVLLGWNNAGMSKAEYKQQAQTFINNIHSDYPNAKIILMGLQIPAKDGLAANYEGNGVYSNYSKLMNYVFSLDDWYAELVNDNSNVYSFNLSGQFDTEYNMPTTTVQVNSRNSETINRQSNGVHPATSGQYQIADAAYRCLTGLL